MVAEHIQMYLEVAEVEDIEPLHKLLLQGHQLLLLSVEVAQVVTLVIVIAKVKILHFQEQI